jgi:cyclic nucleotide gated channel
MMLIVVYQRYVQYMTFRLEDMRVKRRDIEDWMKYRRLPHELVEHVCCFHQYKWVATLGVNEEKLMQNLPMYLRRDIKRHLCLDLVQNVSVFIS